VPVGKCSAVSCEIPHICPCTLSDRNGNKIRCDDMGSNWDLCVENPEFIVERTTTGGNGIHHGNPETTMFPRKNK